MLVTTLCSRFYDGDRIKMLVTESLCWWLFSLCWWFFQFIKSVTNRFCLQHPSLTLMSPSTYLTWRAKHRHEPWLTLIGKFWKTYPEIFPKFQHSRTDSCKTNRVFFKKFNFRDMILTVFGIHEYILVSTYSVTYRSMLHLGNNFRFKTDKFLLESNRWMSFP